MATEVTKGMVASVKFTQSYTPDDGQGSKFTFESGKTYELPLRSADHWVKNGFAEFASEEDEQKAKGKSSDVNLNLADGDREDAVGNTKPEGTGESDADRRDREDREKASKPVHEDLASIKLADLKAIAAERGVTVSGTTKDDYIKALERDSAIKAALAEGRFDDLTVAELQAVAEKQEIDLTGKTAKADVVEAVKAGYKPDEAVAG